MSNLGDVLGIATFRRAPLRHCQLVSEQGLVFLTCSARLGGRDEGLTLDWCFWQPRGRLES